MLDLSKILLGKYIWNIFGNSVLHADNHHTILHFHFVYIQNEGRDSFMTLPKALVLNDLKQLQLKMEWFSMSGFHYAI